MKSFTHRVWITLGITVAIVVAAWLCASLLQGLLVILAGGLFGIFLSKLSALVSQGTKLSYQTAYAIVTATLVLLAGLVIYFSGNQVLARGTEFLQQFEQAQGDIFDHLSSQTWWKDLLGSQISDGQPALPMAAVTGATVFLSRTMAVIGGTFLFFFLGFYFALQPEMYRDGFLSLVPNEYRERISEVISQCCDALWKWMLGRFVGMAVIMVGSTIGLWALGVPLPVTLGVLAGLLTFIPNIGPVVAAVPPLIFAWQQDGNTIWMVLALYLGLQFVESYFLTPLITQHQVALPPGLTLSAQLLFGILGGLLGLALATPIAVIVQVILRELYVKDLLGEEVDADTG